MSDRRKYVDYSNGAGHNLLAIIEQSFRIRVGFVKEVGPGARAGVLTLISGRQGYEDGTGAYHTGHPGSAGLPRLRETQAS